MKRILNLITLIIVLFLTNTAIYGWFKHDYTCLAFPDQCTEESTILSATPRLGQLIPEAGVYFLESKRDFEDMLKELEKSEICGADRVLLKDKIDACITNLEKTYFTYNSIISLVENLEIDVFVLDKLGHFDYNNIQNKFGLIPSIYQKVVSFCRVGDVKGIYIYTFQNLNILLDMLKHIKISIEQGSIPQLYLVWETSQLFCESGLFGQYVSRIFYEISKEMTKR